MREEVDALKWLSIGAVATHMSICDSLIDDNYSEFADEDKVYLRSYFVGSFLSSILSLPINLSDEERKFIIEAVHDDILYDVNWNLAVTLHVSIQLADPPELNHANRDEICKIHTDCIGVVAGRLSEHASKLFDMSTRLALRLFCSYMIDFEDSD